LPESLLRTTRGSPRVARACWPSALPSRGQRCLDAAGDPVEVDALEAGRLFDQELLDYTYVLPAELEGCERAEGMTEQDDYFLFRVE
jgi:hypothetical protein